MERLMSGKDRPSAGVEPHMPRIAGWRTRRELRPLPLLALSELVDEEAMAGLTLASDEGH